MTTFADLPFYVCPQEPVKVPAAGPDKRPQTFIGAPTPYGFLYSRAECTGIARSFDGQPYLGYDAAKALLYQAATNLMEAEDHGHA